MNRIFCKNLLKLSTKYNKIVYNSYYRSILRGCREIDCKGFDLSNPQEITGLMNQAPTKNENLGSFVFIVDIVLGLITNKGRASPPLRDDS